MTFPKCPPFLVLLALLASVAAAKEPVDFEKQVAPILEARCIRCHQPGNKKGDFSLATLKDALQSDYLAPGKPDETYLLDVVVASDGEKPTMPKEGEPLSEQEVRVLRDWVAAGAHWPEGIVLSEKAKADKSWWSLQPLAEAAPPAPQGIPAHWQANPIDRFVFARLQEQGLAPNPPAERRKLIRRLTYDLTGLPPTPAEVEDFVRDTSPGAYERLVDRLLASPHYGEQWGRHWLDVVRFGESNGFERNVIINNLWPFRDYVIRSFNKDKPFNQLVREHLAGDVIGKGDPEKEIGTAFLVCGPYDNVGNRDPVQAAIIRANTIDEMIRATGEAFLGLTVGCARCHNHKFDPIVQRDYYGLYATFAGVTHGARVVATDEQQRSRDAQLKPLAEKRAAVEKPLRELEQEIARRTKAAAAEYAGKWVRPPVSRYKTEDAFEPVQAKFLRLVVESKDTDPNSRTGFRIDELEAWTAEEKPRNVAQAASGAKASGASRVAEDFAGAYSAQRTIDGKFDTRWIAAGPELTIEFAKPETINKVVFSSDRQRVLDKKHRKTTFVGEYRLQVSADGKSWQEVASSHDRKPLSPKHREARLKNIVVTEQEEARLAELRQQLQTVQRAIAAVPDLPQWWAGNFRPAKGPFHVFLGGDPQRKGEAAVPAGLQALSDRDSHYELKAASEGERRLALAKWIVAEDNPLTPRVLANRIWHYHFGTGIVSTPSDFGYMGGKPTHPELLDWLARQLLAGGWRLKSLHKTIVMSQAYRQSAAFRKPAAEVDADSRLLWRFPPRRLTGEEIRDTMLVAAGKLDRRMGGPGFRLYKYLQDNVATYVPLDEHGPDTYRRAVYHQNARAARVDVLSDFDCPDPAFAAPRRASTTTPLQALTTMNHDFVLDMAKSFTERVTASAEAPQQQVEHAFRLAYAREPSQAETQAATRLVEQHGVFALCRALLNSNEFIYVE